MAEITDGDRIQIEYPAPENETAHIWQPGGTTTCPRVWHNGDEVTHRLKRARVGRGSATLDLGGGTLEARDSGESGPGMFDGRVTRC